MPLESIRLSSWRNLADGVVDLAARRVFLIGENGRGKTNFLEAAYYLSYGSSFRGRADSEIARHGVDEFSAEGKVVDEIGTGVPPMRVAVACAFRKKEIRCEGKLVRDRKELIGLNPAIVYSYEDFAFSSGEPERKRFFFDQTAGLVSLSYIELLRDYRRILAHRNAVLKAGDGNVLDVLDLQLAAKGLNLRDERKRVAAEFASGFSFLYEDIAQLGKEVSLKYQPSWKDNLDSVDAVAEHLASKRREEFALGTSLSGPHRDRWGFSAEGRDFTSTASTGQLRLLALTLRSRQAAYFTGMTGRAPLLLLDDVLLELDTTRQRRFFSSLPVSSQAIFTFLPGEEWEAYRGDGALIYKIADGRVSL